MHGRPSAGRGSYRRAVRSVLAVLALLAMAVVGWICITAWDAVVHGHPAYAVLLALTVVGAGVLLWWATRRRPAPRGWRLAGGITGAVLLVAWLGALVWLRPFGAVEPALVALDSTATVLVTESPTQIEMVPGLDPLGVGLLFQPGARVDARAYAAVLRPLADAGYTVVIPKQPLGIAFLATGALDAARDAHPEITSWVVGGHSLGGTVAATIADDHDADPTAPVRGLVLYASYPASDVSGSLVADVLSLYGTQDAIATPADIEASRASLPQEAAVIPIEGAVHAFFGDYGTQPGDGTPTVPHDVARTQIAGETLAFLRGLTP